MSSPYVLENTPRRLGGDFVIFLLSSLIVGSIGLLIWQYQNPREEPEDEEEEDIETPESEEEDSGGDDGSKEKENEESSTSPLLIILLTLGGILFIVGMYLFFTQSSESYWFEEVKKFEKMVANNEMTRAEADKEIKEIKSRITNFDAKMAEYNGTTGPLVERTWFRLPRTGRRGRF